MLKHLHVELNYILRVVRSIPVLATTNDIEVTLNTGS